MVSTILSLLLLLSSCCGGVVLVSFVMRKDRPDLAKSRSSVTQANFKTGMTLSNNSTVLFFPGIEAKVKNENHYQLTASNIIQSIYIMMYLICFATQ